VSYAILDNNRFYAEGLRYALMRRNPFIQVQSQELCWQNQLLDQTILVIRCRFSLSAAHQSLVKILLQLENDCWQGTLYLLCNEMGWALATHLRRRFSSLRIYIIDDRMSVTEAAYVLIKAPRRMRCINYALSDAEFNVLALLIGGLPVRQIATTIRLSEKQISNHKCNALKKLNASNLLQLLL
jgi:DNA-binding CsgD family transcriptional regulator